MFVDQVMCRNAKKKVTTRVYDDRKTEVAEMRMKANNL